MNNPHPGEILYREFMQPMRLSVSRMAEKTGIPAWKVEMIIRHRRNLTHPQCRMLATALKTTPEFWRNLQTAYNAVNLVAL